MFELLSMRFQRVVHQVYEYECHRYNIYKRSIQPPLSASSHHPLPYFSKTIWNELMFFLKTRCFWVASTKLKNAPWRSMSWVERNDLHISIVMQAIPTNPHAFASWRSPKQWSDQLMTFCGRTSPTRMFQSSRGNRWRTLGYKYLSTLQGHPSYHSSCSRIYQKRVSSSSCCCLVCSNNLSKFISTFKMCALAHASPHTPQNSQRVDTWVSQVSPSKSPETVGTTTTLFSSTG